MNKRVITVLVGTLLALIAAVAVVPTRPTGAIPELRAALREVRAWEATSPNIPAPNTPAGQVERLIPDDLQFRWIWSVGEATPGDGEGSRVHWPLLLIQQALVLLLGGGVLTVVVRRERRRNATAKA